MEPKRVSDAGTRESAYPGMVKVELRDGEFVETVWAETTDVSGEFRLDNSPFFAYRVSADDVVEATEIADGVYRFNRVIRPSGNRTVRIAFEGEEPADEDAAQPMLDGLVALGCDFEGAFGRLLAVNVPPPVPLEAVADYLTAAGVRWEYANPKYEDLFPSPG
jgi:hypothetical protein